MGLFDYIGGKMQQTSNEIKAAEMDAFEWSANEICYRLNKTSSMTKCTGYARALKAKCREMSDYELRNTFDRAYNERNAKACNAMLPVMDERGLAHKDDNGRIIRNY